MSRLSLLFVGGLLAASGCGHDHDHDHHHHRPDGEIDEFSMRACDRVGVPGTAVTAAATAADAASAPVAVSDAPYTVTVPDGASGFVEIDVPEMHSYVAMFLQEEGRILSLTEADGTAIPLSTPFVNGACPDEVREDHRWHFHQPGPRVVEIAAGEPVWLMYVLTDFGHFDG